MKFNVLLSMALLTLGCSSDKKEHPLVVAGDFHRTDDELIEIDIRNPRIMKKDEFPSMVDSMFFIKLPDKPLLGTVDKVIVNDSAIYLLDAFQSQQALIYDVSEGSLHKVSHLGRGPNEYNSLTDMAVNRERNEFVLNDGHAGRKLVFDGSGKFIRKEPNMPTVYFDCTERVYLNQMGYGQSFSEELNFHIVSSDQDSVIRKAFPYYPIQKADFIDEGLSRNWRDEILFMPTYCDTVYCIDSDSTYHARYALRQKKSLWERANDRLSDDETVRLMKEEGYTKVNHFLESRDHILFNVSKSHSSGRVLSSPHIYDKRTGVAYEFPNDDNSPAVSGVKNPEIAFDYYTLPDPITVCGDFFVSVFDPILLKYAWEDAVSKGITVEFRDPVFEDIVKNATNGSNPALVFYRLK